MAGPRFYCRSLLKDSLSTASDRTLREYENLVTVRMGNIAKFCPWPALEQSLAQDIAMIWREQKIRQKSKEFKADIEHAILNPPHYNSVADMFTSGETK